MSDRFTQGTIIEYIRSTKYPNIKCQGIIITARCDLAQEKIREFHCLSAMNIDKWIYEVLFENVVKEKEKNILGNIRKYCEKKSMDFLTLCEIDKNKGMEILLNSASSKEKKNIQNIVEEWKEILRLLQSKISDNDKRKFLKANKKIFESKLKALYNSSFPKFAFIPEKAYGCGQSNVQGLVVDLQDVIKFDINVEKPILAYEYDYRVEKDERKRKNINKSFFFNSDSDYVIAENRVLSPWIEYVLQMFANSFTRIGVDNAMIYEIHDFCEKILGE